MQAIILNAGKIPAEMRALFGELPSGSIPINGKPSIIWTLETLYNIGITDVTISVGFKEDESKELIKRYAGNKINVRFIHVDYTKKPGSSLIKCSENIRNEPFIIVLGDTLVTNRIGEDIIKNIAKKESFLLTSYNYVNPSEWCTVSEDGNKRIKKFFEKEAVKEKLPAVIGIYYISNTTAWKRAIESFKDSDVEISQIISRYSEKEPVYSEHTEYWLDIGHLRKYYEAKKAMLASRIFNQIDVDSKLNIITKKSSHRTKLLQEINWYMKTPPKLKALIPQVIDIDLIEPSISMEYVGYPSLSELYLFSSFGSTVWKTIIDRLFEVIDVFKEYKTTVTKKDYRQMYIEKTKTRVEAIKANKNIAELLATDTIKINKKEYDNFAKISEDIYQLTDELYDEKDNTLIHGDLCFPNILFDIGSGSLKLVDPRGKWGNSATGGDIKYDIAKLSHSVLGKYDYIVNDLFRVGKDNETWFLDIHETTNQSEIEKIFLNRLLEDYDKWKIRLIEGLLFISMVPLHGDDVKRQKAQYLNGIMILNNVLKHI